MTNKLILEDLTSLQNDTTAINVINDNSQELVDAFDNTLSLDGSAPNSMQANFDMNNFQILNLPSPGSPTAPLRLTDLNSFIGGGSINTLPPGGTTGQVMAKGSNADYDATWTNSITSIGLSMPTDFTVTNPVITTEGTFGVNWANGTTGSGPMVEAGSPVLTGIPLAPTAAQDTNSTQIATTGFVVAQASVINPIVAGSATPGTSLRYSREDHAHPTDTSRAPLASPTFTGTPAAPTATPGTNTTQLATTAFVIANGVSAGVSSIDSTTGAFTTGSGVTSSAGVIKLANNGATLNTGLSNPTATTSTVGVMMGLGGTAKITPTYSSRVHVSFMGSVENNTSGNTSSVNVRWGTSTAPSNGVSLTGTALLNTMVCGGTGPSEFPFHLSAIITGLTPGTPIWFDLSLAASANTSSLLNLSCVAYEF